MQDLKRDDTGAERKPKRKPKALCDKPKKVKKRPQPYNCLVACVTCYMRPIIVDIMND